MLPVTTSCKKLRKANLEFIMPYDHKTNFLTADMYVSISFQRFSRKCHVGTIAHNVKTDSVLFFLNERQQVFFFSMNSFHSGLSLIGGYLLSK